MFLGGRHIDCFSVPDQEVNYEQITGVYLLLVRARAKFP